MAGKESQDADLADRLAAVLARALGEGVRVEGLRRLTGGASRATYVLEAVGPGEERRRVVLRRDPFAGAANPAAAPDELRVGPDWDGEYEVLRQAAQAGVPVPPLIAKLTPADGLGEGFIVAFVAGETLARRILRDDAFAYARPRMAAQCGEILARIHAVPPERLPTLPVLSTRAHIALYQRRLAQWDEPMPTFELALRWLERHCPREDKEPMCVLHGDFRLGNLTVGPDGVRSVLDWELAHIGNPLEDLSWPQTRAWRFGHFAKPVGGFGETADLVAAYEAVSGNKVDLEQLRFFEIFGSLRWGIMCLMMATRHLSGRVRSLEHAAIGRRASENEHDLLLLLDRA